MARDFIIYPDIKRYDVVVTSTPLAAEFENLVPTFQVESTTFLGTLNYNTIQEITYFLYINGPTSIREKTEPYLLKVTKED